MKVCIVGQGYIGLPTAALFTRNHCEVVGVDVNEEIVKNLNKGIIHIEEHKLQCQCNCCRNNASNYNTKHLTGNPQ